MRRAGVNPVFHYVPLHSAPAGRKYGRAGSAMTHTDGLAERLLRLPLWIGVDTGRVLSAFEHACAGALKA
jgi:dTDP-4-amino-4,6-dideoxygalactose transaminase